MGGISAIIGAIALVGFLVFLAGVGMVVVAASQGRPVRGGVILAVAGLVGGLLLSVVSQGVIVVAPQERAVVFQTLSGNLENPRPAGTHIIVPVLQEATIYDVSRQEYTMAGQSEGQTTGNDSVRARTQDGQEIFLDVTVFFNVATDADRLNQLHRNWEKRYRDEFVRPTVRNLLRNEVANFTAEGIYGEQREVMEDRAQEDLAQTFEDEGLVLNDFLVRDITFSQAFLTSIEEKAVEEQRLQRAETEAERRETEAQGRARATIEEARGDAEATVLQAEADAEALRLVSEQIAANPALIQYEYIQNLADNISLALVPSNSPFLFDFQSIENLPAPQENFSAPEAPEGSIEEQLDQETQDNGTGNNNDGSGSGN